ncbi:hypothetical protein J6590_082005 [Homalodisca vitripennis]|nr:hypothetical protein J6590_082005 [Homalodisca vitripennis]
MLGGETLAVLAKHNVVPQGCYLGPVVFNMYTPDLSSCVWNCTIHHHAVNVSFNYHMVQNSLNRLNGNTNRSICARSCDSTMRSLNVAPNMITHSLPKSEIRVGRRSFSYFGSRSMMAFRRVYGIFPTSNLRAI